MVKRGQGIHQMKLQGGKQNCEDLWVEVILVEVL